MTSMTSVGPRKTPRSLDIRQGTCAYIAFQEMHIKYMHPRVLMPARELQGFGQRLFNIIQADGGDGSIDVRRARLFTKHFIDIAILMWMVEWSDAKTLKGNDPEDLALLGRVIDQVENLSYPITGINDYHTMFLYLEYFCQNAVDSTTSPESRSEGSAPPQDEGSQDVEEFEVEKKSDEGPMYEERTRSEKSIISVDDMRSMSSESRDDQAKSVGVTPIIVHTKPVIIESGYKIVKGMRCIGRLHEHNTEMMGNKLEMDTAMAKAGLQYECPFEWCPHMGTRASGPSGVSAESFRTSSAALLEDHLVQQHHLKKRPSVFWINVMLETYEMMVDQDWIMWHTPYVAENGGIDNQRWMIPKS